jgi:DNA invertase Pin-like site-specific DNA recombinase
MDYGYARVSTSAQDLARQLDALAAAGIAPSATFTDKKTGATTERPGLVQLLALVAPGDTITACTLDRLGRNITDMLVMVRDLKQAGVGLRTIADPIPIDTRTCGAMAEMSVAMLAFFADVERVFMLERVAAAREAKRRRGQATGRPAKISPGQRRRILTLIEDPRSQSSPEDIAADYQISRATLYRELAKARAERAAQPQEVAS